MDMFSEQLIDKVAIVSGHKGKLGTVWKEILESLGVRVYGFDLPEYDLRFEEDIQRFYYSFKSSDCMPDIIINNAAIDNPPGTDTKFWSNLGNIIQVNLIGACKLTKAFLPDMIKKERGVIINIGSILGNVAPDHRNYEGNFEKPSAYSMSKGALLNFTQLLATQWGKHNIRSVCISFAACDVGAKFQEPFKSKFLNCLPLGRFISKESLQLTLLYAILCPELTGQQVLVDSGYCAW